MAVKDFTLDNQPPVPKFTQPEPLSSEQLCDKHWVNITGLRYMTQFGKVACIFGCFQVIWSGFWFPFGCQMMNIGVMLWLAGLFAIICGVILKKPSTQPCARWSLAVAGAVMAAVQLAGSLSMALWCVHEFICRQNVIKDFARFRWYMEQVCYQNEATCTRALVNVNGTERAVRGTALFFDVSPESAEAFLFSFSLAWSYIGCITVSATSTFVCMMLINHAYRNSTGRITHVLPSADTEGSGLISDDSDASSYDMEPDLDTVPRRCVLVGARSYN